MKANVVINNETKKLPAGITEGVEAFWHNGEKWVIAGGVVSRFNEAPAKIQNMIAKAFIADKRSRRYLEKIGITGFENGMDMWYKCVLGTLDGPPDFLNGKFTGNAYNGACKDFECPHRGKFCSLKPGFKNYEIATLEALKGGFTLEQTAALLCISLPGLKSRIKKMKEKLGARNMASLIAKANAYGI
jgi:DNA-binding CsgD family transcriptional regulator